MKTMTDKIKPECYKTKEEIDELIISLDEEEKPPKDLTHTPTDSSDLLDSSYYTGNLKPIVQHYLPDDMELTSEELVEISKGITKKLTGLSSTVPIKCYGDKCPFLLNCPFHKINKLPINSSCAVEAMILDSCTKRYLDEFEVEPDNYSEVTTMTQLGVTHIMEMRGLMSIAIDDDHQRPTGIIENTVGFTPDEEPITQYQEHPGYAIIERAWRWRLKLLESLGATRKEKIKHVDADDNIVRSLSEANASLRAKIDKITTIEGELA